MCNAPDILINLRFIVSNLCTKSIIDANYGILSRLSRSDRFFKVNFARVIQFKVFKTLKFRTLKKLFYSNNFSVPDFLWCCKMPRKGKFFRFFFIISVVNAQKFKLRSFLANIRPNVLFIERNDIWAENLTANVQKILTILYVLLITQILNSV